MRVSICLTAIFVFVSPAAVSAALDWKAAAGQINEYMSRYIRASRREDDTTPRREALDGLRAALTAGFSKECEGPPVFERIRAVLPHCDGLAPERHFGLYSVVSEVISKSLTLSEETEVESFLNYTRKLWRGTSMAAARRSVVQRCLLGRTLAKLIRSAVATDSMVQLTLEMLKAESAWIRPVTRGPVRMSQAVKILKRAPESPSIYGILDALDAVYAVAFLKGTPNKMLEPFVTELVGLLGKIEVRIRGRKKGETIDADDDRCCTQMRLWFRVTSILRRWTGQNDRVWHDEWHAFWSLYAGDDSTGDEPAPPQRVQRKGFDFASVRRGFGAESRTAVRADASKYYGIEVKTSRFLILVDVSGSMLDPDKGIDRLGPLKKETLRFIKSLRPGTHYNILPFSSDCGYDTSLSGSGKLVSKTRPRGAISPRAVEYVTRLQAKGFTRMDRAFAEAFSAVEGATGRPPFDHLFFITDGAPTDDFGNVRGSREEIDELLAFLRGLNARHRVVINAIGFRSAARNVLHRIVKEHRGKLKVIAR